MAKHSVNPELMAEAKALLEGKAPRWQLKEDKAARIEKFAVTTAPEVSQLALAEAFPDDPNPPDGDLYNEQTPIERAIGEIISDVLDCTNYDEFRNPLYRHEVRQAQRRTLEHLLALAENAAPVSAPGQHDEPMPPSAWTIADALRCADALLRRREQDCRDMRLLPVSYHGEDCDRDEFFFPASVLKLAAQDPHWGCLDDPQGPFTIEEHLARSIASTVSEMHRAFDHQQPLSARLRMRILASCRTELALLVRELVATQGGAACK